MKIWKLALLVAFFAFTVQGKFIGNRNLFLVVESKY